jgi:hypothetical protein
VNRRLGSGIEGLLRIIVFLQFLAHHLRAQASSNSAISS